MRALAAVILFCVAQAMVAYAAGAQTFVVHPYLQNMTPHSVQVQWETSRAEQSVVEWGPTQRLGKTATGKALPTRGKRRLHGVALEGLSAGTRYFYRVRTGRLQSGLLELRTPARPSAEANLRLVVLSDTQHDRAHPRVLDSIVRGGLLPLFSGPARATGQAPQLLLIPGDLVAHGRRYKGWRRFFSPLSAITGYAPLFPVAGNHEEDSPHYFRYFDLPRNGSPRQPEHWWWADFSNVRVIGLDTNRGYRNDEQLRWLAQTLRATCNEPHVDFVFAAHHHPEKAELWPGGEARFSARIARSIEQFASACKKPSVIFSGHTHAYARGHSRDAPVSFVHVASAGGDLDRFGEYAGKRYPEFAVRQDEYGFVVVDVRAGEQPSMRIQRIGYGHPERPRAGELRDELRVRKHNVPPERPHAMWPRAERVDPRTAVLTRSRFVDVDGDAHGATRWQLSDGGCDFARPLLDRWFQPQGEPTRAPSEQRHVGVDYMPLPRLAYDARYCFRVRVRDTSLAWSEWSAPQRFQTTRAPLDKVAQGPARSF